MWHSDEIQSLILKDKFFLIPFFPGAIELKSLLNIFFQRKKANSVTKVQSIFHDEFPALTFKSFSKVSCSLSNLRFDT
jgi:hypothetical protein